MRLLTQHGFEDVQSCPYTLVYRAGTESWQYFYEDILHVFRVVLPFFHRWTRVPSDYEEIYQQALKEMQRPDFVATHTLLTVWGRTPTNARGWYMQGVS